MSQESGTTRFSTRSPSDYTVKETNKQSKITYTREFLCSLAKSDLSRIPLDAHLSMSWETEDASALLSPPCCDSDIRCDKPQPSSLKILDDGINLLHKSVEPYLPPWRYKALPPLLKQSNDLHDSEKYRSSDCTSEEKADWESRLQGVHEEKYRADMVTVPKENQLHFNKCTNSEGFSKVFLVSPASRNFKALQSSSTAIIRQLDASHQPSLTRGSVRCEVFHPSILPETTKGYSTKHQSVQEVVSGNTVNEKYKSVNQVDASQRPLPMLEKNMHLEESAACSNFNVGPLDRTHHLIKSQEKRLATFISLEDGENINAYQFEPINEKGYVQLQLNDGSVNVQDSSPARIENNNVLVAHVSALPPPPVEDKHQLISKVDKYESASIHCEAILSLNSIKNAVSISMQNSSSPHLAIPQDFDFESNTCSILDENSDPSIELCLPDEDSLIRFDGPFLMPDEENLAVVDGSIFSPKSKPFKADVDSSSSLCERFEKLVESILDESSASELNDPTAHHKAELDGSFHYAQQNYKKFSPSQSLNQPTYSSLTYHSIPSQTICQSYPLSHEELRKVNHDVNHPMFKQMTIVDKLHSCSFSGWQTKVTTHLPTHQMASCTQELNSIQYCNSECQEPSYCGFMMLNPGSHADRMVDSLLE